MKTVEGKVVLLGSQGVGKTSLINRYIHHTFKNQDNSPTIGASFCVCNMNLGDTRIKFQVWDTAGQERFRSMAPMYYRNANVAFLVFDITQYKTFEAIKSWVIELKGNIEEVMVLILVGNKIDLAEKCIDSDEYRQYADSIGASYHETSVLNNEGVDQVFLTAALGILNLLGDTDHTKIYDSNSLTISNSDVPLSEEAFAKTSIAHGIHEKPYFCC